MPRKTVKKTEAVSISRMDEQEVLRSNYMPFAMSVITDRALPSIDGFKPSQRRILYTMYNMGLLTGNKTKSANIVGQVMRLHPHGDSYGTLVRMTQHHEALLMPLIEGKGSFGKTYSRDAEEAAPRYTEAKLAPVCSEIFSEIKEDAAEMVDNYDSTMKEPRLLPCAFPNILVSSGMGIAVGMACNFPGFNFGEVCRAAAEYIKHPKTDILSIMPAPDFTTKGEILYDEKEMRDIYRTGRGSFAVRGSYTFDAKNSIILITEIPFTTSIEAIVKAVTSLVQKGKLPEISDVRDESGLSGMKIALDVRKDYKDRVKDVMNFLFENTPLQDNFSCNFNLLVDGAPKVLGVTEILDAWIIERTEEKKRVFEHRKDERQAKLHLLKGLEKILLNIDKAIKIIRGSETDKKAKDALMKTFKIDELQAEFVLNIKLRNLNKEYILNHTKDIAGLEKDLAAIEKVLESKNGIKNLIAKELLELDKKYPCPRRTRLVPKEKVEKAAARSRDLGYYQIAEDGYISKSKTGEKVTEDTQILVFTDNQLCYKLYGADLPEKETYIGSAVRVGAGEKVLAYFPLESKKYVATVYEDGHVSLYSQEDFVTLQQRKCIKNAYSDVAKPVGIFSVYKKDSIILMSGKKKTEVKCSELSLQAKKGRGVYVVRSKKGPSVTGAEVKKE